MTHTAEEKLYIAWCDDGMVDGMFAESLVNTVIRMKNELPIRGFARVQGIQIAKQRQKLIEAWEASDVDWMLWLDSDVAITPETISAMWELVDKDTMPVLSGVYYTLWQPEATTMPMPVPAVFRTSEQGSEPFHPLPVNQLIQVSYIGLGLVMLHRSILDKLKKKFPDGVYFNETLGRDGNFNSEDSSFCSKLIESGIDINVHTGITAQHMKRFAVDVNYYNAYWGLQSS